jgi:hypothetical protein
MDDAQRLRMKLYPAAPAIGQVLLERALAVGGVALGVYLVRLWLGH